MTGTTAAASRLASELLATHAEQVEQLTPGLMRDVARRLGRLDVPADSQWPGLVTELLRDFFDVLVADDLQRIDAPGSIYERVGTGAAGAGISADDLAVGIRLSAVRTQAQVHRFVLAGATPADPEAVVELLARVVAAGEAVVVAALRGHALAAGDGESVQARRLGELLVAGAPGAADLAALVGWPAGTHVSAVVVAPEDADRLRGRGDLPFARHERERDVVLVAPVTEGLLATTLRPLVADVDCTVGPVVPLAGLPDSLALGDRLTGRRASGAGPVFVDDELLELASTADRSVLEALRRKYFVEIDRLPAEVREPLLQTLHEWLRHWGHRPATAKALGVHPQTVSGRINRLRDLLADELEDAQVRSELLLLLTALAAED